MTKLEFTIGKACSKVTAYLHSYVCENSHESHPALIVLPGGGYRYTSAREADPVALRYFAHAVNTFILDYPTDKDIIVEKPLETVKQLVDHLIENRKEYGIDEGRMAVIGFSAGAHLAASYGTIYKGEHLKAMILGYPVISSREFGHQGSFQTLCRSEEAKAFYSLEDRVDEDTLPSFIFHTSDDGNVNVRNSLIFADALARHNVPFEMHIFPHGVHGLSVATKETGNRNEEFQSWVDLSIKWLFRQLEFEE